MRIVASAPAKVILFGEHYVVYGATGLVAAIEPYNEIEMESTKSDAAGAGLEYRSTIEENDIDVEFGEKDRTFAHPYAVLYHKLAKHLAPLQKMRVRAQVKFAWPLKGVGNSASLGAALGAGLRKIGGQKTAAHSVFFGDAQTADEVAHGGGRPSGIDAAAASYGGVLEFSKDFKNLARPKIRPIKIAPMPAVEFVLVNTYSVDRARGSTAELISAFAKANGISKKPAEMSKKEREKVFGAYAPLQVFAREALEKGEWGMLGHLMDENHKMVSQMGVSSPGIEKAVAICKSFGALGAKLSGAGGPGGVVIALVEKERIPAVLEALEAGGFETYQFRPAGMGAHVNDGEEKLEKKRKKLHKKERKKLYKSRRIKLHKNRRIKLRKNRRK